MKITINTLVIILVMLLTLPAFAVCPVHKGKLTGSACSINDIKNVENQRTQEKVNLKGEKNLRPVKVTPEIKNSEESQCIFCLQEALFGKENLH